MNFVSHAQNFEDVLLWRALKHVERGFYIDVGAQHPVVDSVSLAFYERGWRGVHVEPSPQYAAMLREARPGDTVLEAAVAARSGALTFYEIPDTGLGTADPDVAEQHRSAGFNVRERRVECATLAELLRPFEGRDVHWMKIDVEGLEQQVIEGWDAGRIRPWIVIVEATRPLTEMQAHQMWEPMLLERGYHFAFFDGLNRFYVAEEHRELLASLNRPANVFDRFELSGDASNTFGGHLARRLADQGTLEAELKSALAAADSLGRELAATRGDVKVHESTIIRLESRVAALGLELEKSARHRAAIESELSRLNAHIAWQQREWDAAREGLGRAEEHLAARAAEIEGVYHSLSWRLTRPLRLANQRWATVLARPKRAASRLRVIADAPPQERPRHLALWLLRRPRLMALCRTALAPLPALKDRLRQYIPADLPESHEAAADSPPGALNESAVPLVNWSAGRPLSDRAAQVLADLRRAIDQSGSNAHRS
jgi:FkbM family methyltransferase